MGKTLFTFWAILVFAVGTFGQKSRSRKPTPKPKPVSVLTSAAEAGDLTENGIFTSTGGKFSIAISTEPVVREKGTAKAQSRGVDTGKRYTWFYGQATYFVTYFPPVDEDGNPYQQSLSTLEDGVRKSVMGYGEVTLTKKDITLGQHRGAEFRSIRGNVLSVGRIYLVGDTGYQIIGVYDDVNREASVIAVLDSFKPLIK